MKKSFTLLVTLFILNIFAILCIYIIQTKSIKNKNLQNQYLYIQAKNHMAFFKNYLKNENLEDISEVKIDNKLFNISAKINQNKISISIKAKNYDVSLYEQF